MLRKRWMCVVLMVAFLAGCGQPVQDPNTLVVWHWMVDRHDVFETLAQKYYDLTGVTVTFKLYAPSDVFSQKVVAAAQARILPDIYGMLEKKSIFADFINSGFVADLTPEFAKDHHAWEKSFFQNALSSNRFEKENIYGVPPGIYGVPLDIMTIQMVYNKDLLKKAGIERPPQTLDTFIKNVEALKRVGIPGLVSGWGEHWMINCFAFNYAFNMMGEQKIMDTFRGKIKYTDPDWLRVFQIFETLTQKEAFMVGIVTKVNKYAEQDFALGRAAFAFNGSWCVNVYREMNPKLNYGVMLPPAVSEDHSLKIWGGAGSSFVVNKRSPHKDKAIQFLKWLSAQEQQAYLARETRNLPSNKNAASELPPVLAEFARGMDHATHPSVWPLDEDALVTEKFDKGLQSIIIGEKTPLEVAQEVQAMKDRQMAKKLRRERR